MHIIIFKKRENYSARISTHVHYLKNNRLRIIFTCFSIGFFEFFLTDLQLCILAVEHVGI